MCGSLGACRRRETREVTVRNASVTENNAPTHVPAVFALCERPRPCTVKLSVCSLPSSALMLPALHR